MGIKNIAPKRWKVDVNVRGLGRKRSIVDGTKAEALQVERQFHDELTGVPRSLTSLNTVGDVFRFYLDRRKNAESAGKFPDACIIRRMIREIGDNRMDGFLYTFEKYLEIIKNEKLMTTKKPMSLTTFGKYKSYAYSAFKEVLDHDLIGKNPLKLLKRDKPIGRDRFMSQEEEERLFTTLKDHKSHLYHATLFAYQIPIRKGELVKAERDRYDQINNRIRLANGTTKNSKGVYIPVPPNMSDYFESIPNESETLFYRRFMNRFVCLGGFNRHWGTMLEKAGIRDFRFHDLRHIAATNLVNKGVPERVVMAIANWKSNMLSTYYHIDPLTVQNVVLESFQVKRGHFVDTLESAV